VGDVDGAATPGYNEDTVWLTNLDSGGGVVSGDVQWDVGDVQLVDESKVLREMISVQVVVTNRR
jgi:hypothetical protein